MLTHQVQNSARFRATSNFYCDYLWSESTYQKLITNFIDCHLCGVKTEKLMNFGVLTKMLQARMLIYRKSTMRVQRMLMRWSSSHVTLLVCYQPLNVFFQSDLGSRADSRWALPQISSFSCVCVFVCFCNGSRS